MSHSTHAQNKAVKKITCLRSAEQFSALMRTRPSTAWNQYLIHASLGRAHPSTSTVVEAHKTPKIPEIPTIELGLIVPKKAYPLAVDRNRIRRVLRAQCAQYLPQLTQTVQLLFRVKANIKYAPQAKTVLQATQQQLKYKVQHEPLLNPHSQAFVGTVRKALNQTFHQLAQADSKPLSYQAPKQGTQ